RGVCDRAYRVWEANGYVQDDIKLTPRLTLNLGLRYDHLGDLADSLGRNASFDASLADRNPPAGGTLAGTTVPSNFSGGAIPAGVTQLHNDFGMNGDGLNTWNPRLGFAWRLPHTERLGLRGGLGGFSSPVSRPTVLSFVHRTAIFTNPVHSSWNQCGSDGAGSLSAQYSHFPRVRAVLPKHNKLHYGV